MEICFCHVEIWGVTTHLSLYFLLFLCGQLDFELGVFRPAVTDSGTPEAALRLGSSPPHAVPGAELMAYYRISTQKLLLQLLLVTIPDTHLGAKKHLSLILLSYSFVLTGF